MPWKPAASVMTLCTTSTNIVLFLLPIPQLTFSPTYFLQTTLVIRFNSDASELCTAPPIHPLHLTVLFPNSAESLSSEIMY